MSSIVKDKLDKIKSFAESTEKRGSKLTLNELNYISDKQLHQKSSGGDSPLKTAKVNLLPDDSILIINDAFNNPYLAFYYPENGDLPPVVGVSSTPSIPFNSWNSRMENRNRIVALQAFLMKTDSYEYSIEGDAEIMENDGDKFIYVTGDCTITVTSKPSE